MSAEGTSAAAPWTVRRVLEWTIGYLKEHGSETPRLDAEVLLAHVRGCPRIKLYTDYDTPLSDAERARMRDLVKRRAQAEPVAYLVGYREFFSMKFIVTPDVFIPRPDTETLVMAAIDAAKELPPPVQILELCTGSGCVSIAIAANLSRTRLTAVEINPRSLEVARQNVEMHQLADRVELRAGNLFDWMIDLIVSNPPYVTSSEISTLQADVRNHEPHRALDGGVDGLDVIRSMIDQAPNYLKPGGWLMFELSPEQAEAACELMRQKGFVDVDTRKDLSGQVRVVCGRTGDG